MTEEYLLELIQKQYYLMIEIRMILSSQQNQN